VWVERDGNNVSLSHLGPGELVGEMSSVDREPRSASATALSDCVVVEFNHEQIVKRIKSMDPVMRQIERLRATNTRITETFETVQDVVASQRHPLDVIDMDCLFDLRWETDIQNAVENDQFELYFQPIIDLASNHLAGFEALIRWNHPELGLISPGDFIPFAEETGLIADISRWCVKKTCSLAPEFQLSALFNRIHVDTLFLNVNISGQNICCEDFGQWIETVIVNSDCPQGMLKLEVTESSVLKNMDVAVQTLTRLQEIGVGIAMDDFGTGQSNLAYLNQLPISTLKIDQSFVTSRLDDLKNQQVVKLILGFANVLDVNVVAEGIETVNDLKYLQSMNCQYGQGFLFSRPLPLADALEFIRNWQSMIDLETCLVNVA